MRNSTNERQSNCVYLFSTQTNVRFSHVAVYNLKLLREIKCESSICISVRTERKAEKGRREQEIEKNGIQDLYVLAVRKMTKV